MCVVSPLTDIQRQFIVNQQSRLDKTEGSCPLQSRDHLKHSVDTLDTCVGTNIFTPDLGVITKYLLVIDCAKLPLDGVSTVVSQNLCHGPGCSRSRRVTGSYGRSTGIEDLVDTSREHGRSAVSMETMDSYGFTCKGALSPYARRARHSHEEDQAQMVTTQGLERQESTEGMRRRSSVEGGDSRS